jgi:hypothetical protein
MRTLSFVLLVTLTSAFCVHAQMRTDKEATYALVGPVRAVRTETATVVKKDGLYIEGPRVLQMIISFNEDGNRTELGLYDDTGALNRRIVSRFEGPRLIEFLNYDGAGKMWLRGVDLYDAAGRTREKATYNGDGSLRSRTVFTRNDRGQLVQWAEYSAMGIVMDKVNNTFNDAGELKTVERSYYRPDGSLQLREVHELSSKRSEMVTYKADGSVAGKSIRVNQEITRYAEDGALRKTTSISNQGRLPDEVMLNEDGTTRRESQIPDQIDAQRNWIKQTKWITDSNGVRPVKVTYRSISYYE